MNFTIDGTQETRSRLYRICFAKKSEPAKTTKLEEMTVLSDAFKVPVDMVLQAAVAVAAAACVQQSYMAVAEMAPQSVAIAVVLHP